MLASGRTLAPVEVAYETYGALNAERTNALFVCHALTGDAHAASAGDPARPGWWDTLIGPGKPVDTDRLFVVCANLLGGCQGTTGPSSLDPATGRPYGPRFPQLAVSDLVEVHRALLRRLGIERLLGAIGGSIGGMQVLQWALDHPGELASGLLVCATARLSAQNIAFSEVARIAITNDPAFHGGDYYDAPGGGPDAGLALARMIAHITYLSERSMRERFGRRTRPLADGAGPGVQFEVQSYLHHQGDSFVRRFDANTYLLFTHIMDAFDPLAARAAAVAALARSGTRFLVLSFDTDWRFDTSHSRELVRAMGEARTPVTFREIASPHGHDSFLLTVPDYHRSVAAFLGSMEHDLAGAAPPAPLPPDLRPVAALVPPGSRVLHLGCGDGALLAHLAAGRGCAGYGVEHGADAVIGAIERGVPVVELDPEDALAELGDDWFDVAILSGMPPAPRLQRELLRVARAAIVPSPAAGHVRLER